jgi:malonate transporter and related proteins
LEGVSGVRGISLRLLAVKLLALPTGSSAYIMAMRMGDDGRSVAWLISAITLNSMLTLPLWAAWLTA